MQNHWDLLKRIMVMLIMALMSTIITLIMSHISNSISQQLYWMPNVASGKKNWVKNLTNYERQIYENVVEPENIQDSLESIGGLSAIKDDIHANILLPLKHPHIFCSKESGNLKPTRGILLYGPPGTGKTMLARAIAKECNVPFISLSLSSLENKWYGESSKLIQATFSLARKIQPCIIFFDEIDGLLKQRSDHDQSAVYGFKTELLTQIDGMHTQQDDSMFVIGTTNNVKFLDPAIKRRMPKVFEVALPNDKDREEILKLKTAQEQLDPALVNWIVKASHDMSGSDITELVKQASAARFKQQCTDDSFKCALEHAASVDDLPPLRNIEKEHFLQAFQALGRPVSQEDEVVLEEENEEEEEGPP